MSAFDKLQGWSFGGIRFPAGRWSIKGGIRDHVHEYWKTDGGDPEKGGRKLYEFTVLGNFQDRFKRFPDLYPNQLDKLIRLFELSRTEDLVVPFRGTIRAYAIDWTENAEAKIRSGEMVEIKFREDSTQPFTIELTDTSSKSIATGASSLTAVLDQQSLNLPQTDTDLFSQINALANSIIAISDTSALYGQLVAAKVLQLTSLLDAADRLTSMQGADAQPIVDALHELWAAAVAFGKDVQGKRVLLQRWVVVATMSVSQVSQAIYGDTSRADELMSLNTGTIRDPFRVLAGTSLVYYPTS